MQNGDKESPHGKQQGDLFKPLLRDIVSLRHAMVKLANAIDLQSFKDGLAASFCVKNGRPSCPVRLMVALHYLKYASGMSDEAVLDEWLENLYWQYFTRGIYFEYEDPKLLELGERLFNQKKSDKRKLYSIHEPQVECIGKGKAHKKIEFGTKVGLVTSAKTNWIVGAKAYPGNPYDGHTLKSVLQQATKILGFEPVMAICDLGCRGHNYVGDCDIQVVNRFRKRVSRTLCRWWNRWSAIEPVIRHCKSEHRMDRNQLRGRIGDELNVIFAAAEFNLRKLLRAYALFWHPFFLFTFLQLVLQLQKRYSNRFGKERAREGKNLSLKGFSFSHLAFA
ncbi:transposase [Victivallis sp. Marseille-Q1083]|uniref:transposase n=1 Tax=Victivallis sp. Marseille-Q1083 TaxID=2717288 RepID=UPI00158A1313|nr:transposase [Victivallis sp. Marseille-Q1083]